MENIVFNTLGDIINVNPQFCDPSNNQFSLQEGSFCLTASDSGSVIGAFDLPCDNLNIDKIIASDYSFIQNFPNPFNNQTKILYALENEGRYSILIFNIRGQLVKNLISKFGQKGGYEIKWDGTNNFGRKVVSGVYICRLETMNGITDNKMILLK